MKKNKRQRVEKLLIEYKDILKITVIERKLGFSRGVIAKFYKKKKKRKLQDKEIDAIDELVEKLIDSYYCDLDN